MTQRTATLRFMTFRAYDLRDPGAIVAHVLGVHQPNDGDACLALVHDPPGAQLVVHVTSIASAQWASLERFDRSELLRTLVRDMPIDTTTWRRPEHAVVTVIARSGLAVFGPNELDWLLAWRYSNHLAPVFDAGPVLVTEHGWVDFMGKRGASTPRFTRP